MNYAVSSATIAATATPLPGLAQPDPRAANHLDALAPILAAIDAHQIAYRRLYDAVKLHSRLEDEIPRHLRKSNIDAWEATIVDTDDPRWIESEREIDVVQDAFDDAELNLIDTEPATLAGAVALMRHVTALEAKGHYWPSGLLDDDDEPTARGRDWAVYLHRNITAVLERVA